MQLVCRKNKIEEKKRLILTTHLYKRIRLLVILCFFGARQKSWNLDSLGSCTCSYLFCKIPNLHSKSFWEIKVPSKVMAFVWTMILNGINTSDLIPRAHTLVLLSIIF